MLDEITTDLAAEDVDRRREAATELRQIGMQKRTSLKKRGTLKSAADSPLGNQEIVNALNSAISDSDPEVRLQVIGCAADLGDGTSVKALENSLQDDRSEIKLAAIDALGEIGGSDSVQALANLVGGETESEDVRLAALSELEELAAKNITSGPDRRFNPVEATPGAGESVDESALGEAELVLADTLEKVRSSEQQDPLLKLKAHDVLSYVRGEAIPE
jgi:HEAT repeat protein